MESKPGSSDSENLCRKSENCLGRDSVSSNGKMDVLDERVLLHELQIRQIELKMQNEELQHAKAEAEIALSKYTDLYEFAPVGYSRINPLRTESITLPL